MFIAAAFIITGLVAWLVHRDIRRAVRRRELAAKMAAFRAATRAAGATIGAAIAPAMGKMVRAAADFERSMAQVAAAFGKTGDDLARLAEEVQRASREQPVDVAPLTWALREHARVSACED